MDLEHIINAGSMFILGGSIGLYLGAKLARRNPGRGDNVIAVVPITGKLVSINYANAPGKITAKKFIRTMEALKHNKKVKGIIFDINSGGGVVYQSKEIAEYIANKVEVPNVALARDVCASGAYMIACASDYIVAREESAVGSIGVITAHLAASGLLEKLGIEYDVLKAGKNKDAHLPLKKLTEEQRIITQEQIDEIYNMFIQFVAKHRYRNNRANNPTEEDIRKIATGDVYYGRKSLEYGLIDEIGSKDGAIAYLEKAGNFKHSGIYEIEEVSGLLSKLGFKMGTSIGTAIGTSIADRLLSVDVNKTSY